MVNKIRSVNKVFNNTDLRRKPRAQAESRQLAASAVLSVNTWVLGSILRACLFMIRL